MPGLVSGIHGSWQGPCRDRWMAGTSPAKTKVCSLCLGVKTTGAPLPLMPLVGIALTSAGLLAYEVLLTRLFSIIQWHHFAYMVISIALLGYGASGTFLVLAQQRMRRRFIGVFATCAALFAVSAIAAFAVAQRLPFNALAVIWEPVQLFYLLALYLLFAVPFACGATCVGLALVTFTFPSNIGHIYRSDMLGAGAGALGIVAGLFVLSPSQALQGV